MDRIKTNQTEIPSFMTTGMGDVKLDDRVQVIIGYEVIEKTKSYTVLKINTIYKLSPSRRY